MTPILGLDNRSSHSHGYGHKWGPLDRGVITTNSLQVWERHVGGETRDLQENAEAAPGGTMGGTRRVCVSKNRGTDAGRGRPPGGGTPAIGATNCQGLPSASLQATTAVYSFVLALRWPPLSLFLFVTYDLRPKSIPHAQS